MYPSVLKMISRYLLHFMPIYFCQLCKTPRKGAEDASASNRYGVLLNPISLT